MDNDTPDDTAQDTASAEKPLKLAKWKPSGKHTDPQPGRARRLIWTSRLVIIGLSLCFVGLLGRVYQLQAHPDPKIVQLQDSQIGKAGLAAMRGGIIDRTGRVLAATRIGYRLYCDPGMIADRAVFAETIAYTLGYNPVDIDKKLSGRSRSRYVVLDQRMTDQQVDLFERLQLPGVYIEPITVRDYPQGELAGTLIGFVGRDGNGLEGLERQWEDRLSGTDGSYKFMRDYKRRRMWVTGRDYVPYSDGENIRLTIDAYIQRICEQELAKVVKHHKAKSGQIIVMQPHTGEILAIATYPTYDPNRFGDVNDDQRRNRPVTDIFEPGSIFKPFIWAGLTEMGVVKPSDTFNIPGKTWVMPNGRTLRDASWHGNSLTWHQILKYSSNIGMAKGAHRVKVEQVYNIMQSFGFGKKSGIDLPGEVPGMLRLSTHSGARGYSHGSWPMGQEVGVTGIQVARAMCVLANGGVMVTPHIEALRPTPKGQPDTEPRRVISKRVADATIAAMHDAVQTGTGRKAKSPYYDIFGKTGTAQLPNLVTGGYYQNRYMSSFLGGAPSDKPRLVVGCFINDPDKKIAHYGGLVAAPAVKNVIERSLVYLGVPPNPGTDPTDRIDDQFEIIE